MSKNNRSVRPRLFRGAPTLLDQARFTGLNCQQIRLLAQALNQTAKRDDLEEVLYQLPLRAVEPFLIAAFLSVCPLPIECVASLLARVGDIYSLVRVVSVTTGDRIGVLLDMVESEPLEPFRRAVALYLCVDLLQGASPSTRLVDSLRETYQARTSWMSEIVLRDIALRLEVTELLRLTRASDRHWQSPAGQIVASQFRHRLFESPLLGLPENETVVSGRVELEHPIAGVEIRAGDTVQRIALPAQLMADLNFETLDSRGLYQVYKMLAGSRLWESAERAMDELMTRGIDPSLQKGFIDALLADGQLSLAQRQRARAACGQPKMEPSWFQGRRAA